MTALQKVGMISRFAFAMICCLYMTPSYCQTIMKGSSVVESSPDLYADFRLFEQVKKLSHLKPYELWWENSLGSQVSMQTFSSWLGDINVPSRVAVRKYLKAKKYSSILDIPSGMCIDFFGFKHDNIEIDYYGVEITPKLVCYGKKLGINVVLGSIEKIPMHNSCLDVCYARHILEHLDYYHKAISEMIRVAKKEVIIVFFIKPNNRPDHINYYEKNGYELYENHYNQQKIEKYVASLAQVDYFEWEQVKWREKSFHIYLTTKQNSD